MITYSVIGFSVTAVVGLKRFIHRQPKTSITVSPPPAENTALLKIRSSTAFFLNYMTPCDCFLPSC
jgi:hypothetical protein